MKAAGYPVGKNRPRIRIQKPTIEYPAEETLWEEVRKFAKMVPSEPDPNMGRVQEIKEEIRRGTYLTPEILEETAARLAIRFLQKE